jgi:N-acetylmuramoyl-L-alanine amidase
MLKLHDKGKEVVNLQTALKRLMIYDGILSGIFNIEVETAVKFLQKENGLKDDGVVGPATWALIRSLNPLKYLVIHCSATREGQNITSTQIKNMHTLPVEKGGRGWSRVGYSDFILLDGTVENLRGYNDDMWVQANEITNGALGFNNVSRHICYAGGVMIDGKTPKDTRTQEQRFALENYVLDMISKYPHIQILGHNQVANKACPSFSVPVWLRSLGISEKNIYNG